MAINKSKTLKDIVDVSENRDPLKSQNLKEDTIERKTLPYSNNDTVLMKHQTVFESLNDILDKLRQNDLFSNNYISKSSGYVGEDKNSNIIQAFSYDQKTGGYPPNNNETYEGYYERHITKYHTDAEYGLWQVKENYMETDFSNFDLKKSRKNFQKTYPDNNKFNSTDNITFKNDFITFTEFGDDDSLPNHNNYVTVSICNKNTEWKFRQTVSTNETLHRSIPSTSSSAYIYNEWLSGLKDLMIYIPSTFTFYNDNSEGCGISENQTFVRVVINKRHFEFNHFYNIEICGTSLPLQISKETTPYFNDTIQPSILRTMCMSKSIENNTYQIYSDRTNSYTLYFACYGSDEQSIRIQGD